MDCGRAPNGMGHLIILLIITTRVCWYEYDSIARTYGVVIFDNEPIEADVTE